MATLSDLLALPQGSSEACAQTRGVSDSLSKVFPEPAPRQLAATCTTFNTPPQIGSGVLCKRSSGKWEPGWVVTRHEIRIEKRNTQDLVSTSNPAKKQHAIFKAVNFADWHETIRLKDSPKLASDDIMSSTSSTQPGVLRVRPRLPRPLTAYQLSKAISASHHASNALELLPHDGYIHRCSDGNKTRYLEFQLTLLRNLLSEARADLSEVKARLSNTESSLATANQRLSKLREKFAQAQHEIDDAQTDAKKQRESFERVQRLLSKAQRATAESRKESEKLKSKILDIQVHYDHEAKQSRREADDARERLSDFQSQLEITKAENAKLLDFARRVNEEKTKLKEEARQLDVKLLQSRHGAKGLQAAWQRDTKELQRLHKRETGQVALINNLKSRFMCTGCHKRFRSRAFYPCGHVLQCDSCIEDFEVGDPCSHKACRIPIQLIAPVTLLT